MKHTFLHNAGDGNVIFFTTASSPINSENSEKLSPLLRDAALRGWKIFPVLVRSRYATESTAMIGQATRDLDQLKAWAREYPGCNWAVATGKDSGVLAIEIDGYIGTSSFSWLLFENQEEEIGTPQTLISQTENGANDTVYAYYRWPATLTMRQLRGEIAPGMRLRGEGDSVPIPPSIHSNGIRFSYPHPDAEVAAMPHWLIDLAFEVPEAEAEAAPAKFPPR